MLVSTLKVLDWRAILLFAKLRTAGVDDSSALTILLYDSHKWACLYTNETSFLFTFQTARYLMVQ